MSAYIGVFVSLSIDGEFQYQALARTIADVIVVTCNTCSLCWLRGKLDNINNASLKVQVAKVKRQFGVFLLSYFLLVIVDVLDYLTDNVISEGSRSFGLQLVIRVLLRVFIVAPVFYVLLVHRTAFKSDKTPMLASQQSS